MLFPLEKLLGRLEELVYVYQGTTIRDALTLMVKKDFSQLPIVGSNGNLVGIISERTIVGNYYHLNGSVSLLDLTVDHCQTPAVTLPVDSDLFDALDRLKDVYAIIIVEGQKPVGILTDYDTTYFFRDLSEGLIFIEDIEVTLRQYIEAAFPDEKAMFAALMVAFGPNRRDPSRPGKEYEELSFGEHLQLITADRNWEQFKGVFEPKNFFNHLLIPVGQIRVVCQWLCKISASGCLDDGAGIVSLWKRKLRMTA